MHVEGAPALDHCGLVPDHALMPGEDDLFRHGDFVERLITVIQTASVKHASANVALFGSWGSGKSGTANLLAERLKNQPECHSATFNAFTYGRRPLLRQFVVHLAEQLLDEDRAEEYRCEVYEEATSPRIDFRGLSWEHLKKPLRTVAWILLATSTLVLLALNFASGSLRDALQDTITGIFPALVPSAVLVAVIAWGLRFVTVTSTRAIPESEEQFEQLFMRLLRDDLGVDREGDKRLVVFIDELDRCSPTEVVATLETLRTFLGVPGCVFVVAADQQALEHALTQEVSQATPADPANPYYSAGNAYLDKIFQYQLAFPPLRPRRLTHYALRLVIGRGGIWTEIDAEDAISVLLPVHVHSPRRVKVLLNSFALAYATAKARSTRKELDQDLPARASELAKLVCLRTEFPLFARDLELSDRLVDAVLRAREAIGTGTDPLSDGALNDLPDGLAQRAVLYAKGSLPVAELLMDQASDASVDEDADDDASQPAGRKGVVQHAYGLQLLDYLEKTADVPGPRDDLIYLEGAGAIWGLDPLIAQRLQDDALGNRPDDVVATIRELTDSAQRSSALRVLGALTRESLGNDADNAARALLASVSEVELPLDTVASSVIGDIEHYRRRRGLQSRDLSGALTLAIAAGDRSLLEYLLGREEALSDQPFRLKLMAASPSLFNGHSGRMSRVFAAQLASSGSACGDVLLDIPDRQLQAVLVPALGQFEKDYRAETKAARAIEDEEARSKALSRAKVKLDECAYVAHALVEGGRSQTAELFLIPLSSIGLASRHERQLLSEVKPLTTIEATAAIIKDLSQWEDGNAVIVELLSALDSRLIGDTPDLVLGLGEFASWLWTDLRSRSEEIPEDLRLEVGRVLSASEPLANDALVEAVSDALAIAADSQEAVDQLDRDVRRAGAFMDLGLVSAEVVGDGLAKASALSVQASVPEADQGAIANALVRWVVRASRSASVKSLLDFQEALVADSCWLPSPAREMAALNVEAGLPPNNRSRDLSPEDVAALGRDYGRDAAEGVSAFIRGLASSPSDVFVVVRPFISVSLPQSIAEALGDYAEGLDSQGVARLNSVAVRQAFELVPSREFFRAAHIDTADEDLFASDLIDLFSRVDNRGQREQVLDLWELANPVSENARRRLIREIFLPLAASGVEAFDLSRRHLKLCAEPPYATKQQIVDALAACAPDEKRAKQMRKRLVEIGLIKEKQQKSWLRRAIGL